MQSLALPPESEGLGSPSPRFPDFLGLSYSYLWLKIEHSIEKAMQSKTKTKQKIKQNRNVKTNKTPRTFAGGLFLLAEGIFIHTHTRRWGMAERPRGRTPFPGRPADSDRDGTDPEPAPPEPKPSFSACNSRCREGRETKIGAVLANRAPRGEFCNGGRRF